MAIVIILVVKPILVGERFAGSDEVRGEARAGENRWASRADGTNDQTSKDYTEWRSTASKFTASTFH